MNRIVIGALAGIGIAGMATAPGAYAAQTSTEVAPRAPAQSPENIVVAEAKKKGGGAGRRWRHGCWRRRRNGRGRWRRNGRRRWRRHGRRLAAVEWARGGGGGMGGGGGGGMGGGGGGVVGGMGGGGGGGRNGWRRWCCCRRNGRRRWRRRNGRWRRWRWNGWRRWWWWRWNGSAGSAVAAWAEWAALPSSAAGRWSSFPGHVTYDGAGATAASSPSARCRWPRRDRDFRTPLLCHRISGGGRDAQRCTGVTAEGCELRLVDVPMDGGGIASVCVQYCPSEDGQPPQGVPVPQQ